jgi:hypothetical protein
MDGAKGRELRAGGGSQQGCVPGFREGLTRKGQRTKRSSGEGKSTEVVEVVAVLAVAGVAVAVAVVAAGVAVAVAVVAAGVAVAVVIVVAVVAAGVAVGVAIEVAVADAVAVAVDFVADTEDFLASVVDIVGAFGCLVDSMYLARSDSAVHPEVSVSAQVRSLDKFVRSENGEDENKLLAVVCDSAAVGVAGTWNCCIQQNLAWEGA